MITVVSGPSDVRAALARGGAEPVVSRDTETLVFADGRIVTSKLDGVGAHLNALGWIDREIVISSVFGRGGAGGLRRG